MLKVFCKLVGKGVPKLKLGYPLKIKNHETKILKDLEQSPIQLNLNFAVC